MGDKEIDTFAEVIAKARNYNYIRGIKISFLRQELNEPRVKVQEMQQGNELEQERIERALRMITECSDILFDHASVMMHSINREGELLKVNGRWLAALGYDRGEVLGHQSVEFLTGESRAQAATDTLPLFWSVGSTSSIGYRMVRKSGRVISVLLDGEAVDDGEGGVFGLAVLRAPDDLTQWRQASATRGTLQKIGQVQRQLKRLLSAQEVGQGIANAPPLTSSSIPEARAEPLLALMIGLVELAQEVSENLRTMARVQARRLDVLLNSESQLILLADTIETSIAELASGESDLENPE